MASPDDTNRSVAHGVPVRPAEPLWQLAPTRGDDGRCLADFMMLIPGLSNGESAVRQHVTRTVQGVCEEFGQSVAFADINYRLNILWISVEAEPGLAGRVAAAVRLRLPDAMLVGGQLGAVPGLPMATRWRKLWSSLRRLPVPLVARLPRGSR